VQAGRRRKTGARRCPRIDVLRPAGSYEDHPRSLLYTEGCIRPFARRSLELDENTQRLDLDSYEASKQRMAEIRQEEAAFKEEESNRADSARKVGHRPRGGRKEVARRAGVPESTIRDSERHVEVAERYPRVAEGSLQFVKEVGDRVLDHVLLSGNVLPLRLIGSLGMPNHADRVSPANPAFDLPDPISLVETEVFEVQPSLELDPQHPELGSIEIVDVLHFDSSAAC
jgi:hypothetical protein